MKNMIAIITARGGSKRIPGKNIKEFMGKPMLAYAIEAAVSSHLFDTVMVSTDDKEIAEVAKKWGAEVPFMRSETTSSDYATTTDVLIEVIQEYKKQGLEYKKLCCIYPCVPFLSSKSLIEAYERFTDDVDALMPVCKYPVPVEWAVSIREGLVNNFDPEGWKIRSQDLEPKYYDVGMFYFVMTEKMLQYQSVRPPRTAAYIIDESECQDIDTMDDWKSAELKYKILHKEEK